MTLRELIFNAATTYVGLTSLGVTVDNTFDSESVESPQMRPFTVIRYGVLDKGVGAVNKQTIDVIVYDTPGDFTNIEKMLQAWRALMLSLPATGSGGCWVLGVEWRGDSPDIRDDTFQAIGRSAGFSVAASGT